MITPYILQPPDYPWIATLHIQEMKEYVVSDVFPDQDSLERWVRKQYGLAFANCVTRYMHQRKKSAELAGWPNASAQVMEYLEREMSGIDKAPLATVLFKIQKVKDQLIAFLPSDKSNFRRWRNVIPDLIAQTEQLQKAMKAAGQKSCSNPLTVETLIPAV